MVIDPTLVESLHLALSTSTDCHYRHCSSLDEVVEIVGRSTRVVLLVNLAAKEEVTEFYRKLPEIDSRIKDGTLKVFLLNSLVHPKLRDLLRTRTAIEIVEMPVTQKVLQYKLKSALVSVHQNYMRSDEVTNPAIAVGADRRASMRAKPKVLGADILWQPAAEFNSDFWWIPDGKSIRVILGVWLIDMVGPGPAAGTWELIPDAEMDGQQAWAWKSRWLADEIFQTPGGRWVFYGRQAPEFSWAKTTWNFVGKAPMLAYFETGSASPTCTRFEYRLDEGFIARDNSSSAKILLPRIRATFANRPGLARSRVETLPEVSVIQDEAPTAEPPHRGPLTPWGPHAPELGLLDRVPAMLVSGASAYSRMGFGVDVVRKNGVLGDGNLQPPIPYDIQSNGATLLLVPANAEVGDRFHFRFRFNSGEKSTECLMEWEIKQIEMTMGDQLLASGEFVSGDFAPLVHVLELLEERKQALKEFFFTAGQ